MDKDDIEKVARGLSKAQKHALQYAIRDEGFRGAGRYKANGTWRTTNKLFYAFLTDEDEWLTEDGLAVRAYLQEQHQ